MPARVPVFAVTGTSGKSTTVRMLAHILGQSGLTVGFTTTTGIHIGGEQIATADASGPRSARTILRDPTVEVAVLETARGGLLREGLGFDQADVGCVLNVSADHLGLKGVDTIEDLANVKSIVVESVARHGTSVLNADDPLTAAMARRAGGRICFFSMRAPDDRPAFLRDHIARDGLAVVREPGAFGGDIVVHEDGDALFVMRAAEVPATIEGLAEFNIANALAAMAMAFAQGHEVGQIRAAMAGFTSAFEHSPGRLNIFDGHGFRVILDYAHNPDGLPARGAGHRGPARGQVPAPHGRTGLGLEERRAEPARLAGLAPDLSTRPPSRSAAWTWRARQAGVIKARFPHLGPGSGPVWSACPGGARSHVDVIAGTSVALR
ncbi:Mur ligase family protein [Rubellimicrobium aerolatum]|uniref:Mur ligase family protein n=1 Tax=Rubellimicrobium aerolatum TaxID=490979 RepID=A0ABW0SCH4_9RHOB|nr:Mur ligase family protein [Rubellimicrobium aerolatum]MBP1806300.1 cyanophycin synthetase [Rubellimicrobium aerolatum]